ncbi:MAG TPA: cyclic nucleotide-binding domain-containing protein [Polyangiales bacterium]
MTAADDTLADYLKQHPVLAGLDARQVAQVVSYATAADYKPGALIFQRDFDAQEFFIVRRGRIAIEVPSIEGEALQIQTVGEGSLLGWSWFVPPYRWSFDARAVEPSNLISIDGAKLRAACDNDPKLGYALMKRFAALMAERLNAARIAAMRHYADS